MKTIYHPSDKRGFADHGWLKSHHSFSFASYYNPEQIRFGLLRVLNDDSVAGGMGFGSHPHDNMEIISIPLSGSLEHQDSMGNKHVISQGEVQVMSAGTGVTHSEKNHSKTEPVNFLQIWIFPKLKDIQPKYDQKLFPFNEHKNDLLPLISPDGRENTLVINQDAFFYHGHITEGQGINFKLNDPKHGVYIFVLEGGISIEENKLSTRDGLGIYETDAIKINGLKESSFILMELPMN